MKQETGVTHWVDGERTWSLGIQGFLIQAKGFVTQSLIALPFAGVPFWWPQETKLSQLPLLGKIGIAASIFILLALALSAAVYLRKRVKRSLRLKSQLHFFAHSLRDAFDETLERSKGKGGKPSAEDPLHQRAHIRSVSNRAADAIAAYFSTITGDESVGCAIRLAQDKLGDKRDEIHYVTVGRSKNLNPNRSATTEPVSRKEGIPKLFLAEEKASQGILFIDDLQKASASGCYKQTRNDKLHGTDFSTMVVMPINGWNGLKKDLIGLVCVTSKSHKLLQTRHVDLFKFTSDTIALFYVAVISRLQATGKMPHLTELSEFESQQP